MKVVFGRKVSNLDELKELIDGINQNQRGQAYTVTKEVFLGDTEFKEFTSDFFNDQPWITKDDGGMNDKGDIRCIRVINQDTGEKVLVNNEGYDYARYVTIENE